MSSQFHLTVLLLLCCSIFLSAFCVLARGQVLGLACKQIDVATALTEPVVFMDGIEGQIGAHCSRNKGYK